MLIILIFATPSRIEVIIILLIIILILILIILIITARIVVLLLLTPPLTPTLSLSRGFRGRSDNRTAVGIVVAA